MAELEKLLNRAKEMAKATGSADGKKDGEGDEELDEFTKLKNEICEMERQTRLDIKARDEFAEAIGTRDQKAEIVKQTSQIRNKIKEMRNKVDQLRQMVADQEEQLRKKNKTSEGLQNRKKLCDLCDARIDECERWAKGHSFVSAKDDPKKRALLKGANFDDTATPQLAHFVPSPTESEYEEIAGIEDWRLQINKNEQEIDQKLDQLVEGTSALVHIANQLHDEYEILGRMTDEVDEKMDKVDAKLESTNERVNALLEKVGGCSNCCIDIFLVLVILACLYFIASKFIKI
ncbi:hypothetical protein TVAG_363990 [Trichomonas vaginalis G3]|uniref:t-SNARE coiled-coil homology domain-containing protein n=1 Tax=Trichomonas vaginalis (strain ATCC PRA-98 / G3) TaxID=412133 RepID=A2EDW8_TRIV3|nr:SNARE fusion complex family [Trichomonas vaginalis G3]EAY09184.1 hypothetical protein TVAG_363990 [Trichomonas vaginalis G3]KAI5487029.1 SNARE fusion complex family [Trichomonas vaginalis G3]|eukprot:XP_001321407.1 hypothetical protein [Trichomonas vaginalis G3]